jgi:hypothetical protein
MSDGPATKADLIEALAVSKRRLTINLAFIFAAELIAAIAVILLVVPHLYPGQAPS